MTVSKRSSYQRVLTIAALYLVAYLIASFMDLSTTSMALKQSGVHEGNVFATTADSYATLKAWLITLIGGLIMTACVIFAMRNAGRVEEHWLRHPMRSFGLFYVNPWSASAVGRSPLHMLSFAVAFVVLRVLAAGNNLLIYWYGVAPIGAPIQWIAERTSAIFGLAAVIIPAFYLLAILVSPMAAKVITTWRNEAE